jgi:photosystem II stability/assembly factor-like uncharacterized protein
VERLEGRALLSSWVEQGPAPIGYSSMVEGMDAQYSPVAGAVEALAPDPSNPDVLYAGTVNGGVWKTTDATDPFPTWLPLTDRLPSLAISDLEFSPADPTHRTLYAATGSFRSGSISLGFGGVPSTTSDGGPGAGIYKTTDGGATWRVLGRSIFGDRRIAAVVPTALDGGRVVLAGARNLLNLDGSLADYGGVYRSADGGATWTRISGTDGLPSGAVSDLTGDPRDPRRFYATILQPTGTHLYRSDDGGLTWAPKEEGLFGNLEPGARIMLAIHDDPGHDVVYAAVLILPTSVTVGPDGNHFNGRLAGLFRSTDQGEHWTAMALPGDADGGIFLNGQTTVQFAMAADSTDPNVVFVSGDSEEPPFPKANGTTGYVDRSFRGDASLPPARQWTALDGNGAGGTAPHSDSRDFAFDARGDLLQADDGGIYRLINPDAAPDAGPRHWVAVIGDLGVTELYSVAYDDLNHVILGGAQDTGVAEQFAPGSFAWQQFQSGDGGVVQVDDSGLPGRSLLYLETQSGRSFRILVFDGSGDFLGYHNLRLIVAGTGGKDLFQVDTTEQDVQPYELNAVDPTRMLLGTSYLYESFDRGDHLERLAGGAEIGPVTAMSYGGRLRGVANPDVAYVGTAGPAKLLLRTTAGGAFTPLTAYPGAVPLDLAVDPQDWRRAYVVDASDHVWATFNAGRYWIDITGDLNTLTPAPRVGPSGFFPSLRTVAIISPTPGIAGDIVLIGGFGGVYAIRHPGLGGSSLDWTRLGTGFPTVVVNDVRYDAKDDLVIAGTYGRGAWTLLHPGRSIPWAGGGTILAAAQPANGFGGELTRIANQIEILSFGPVDQIEVFSFGFAGDRAPGHGPWTLRHHGRSIPVSGLGVGTALAAAQPADWLGEEPGQAATVDQIEVLSFGLVHVSDINWM